MNKNKTSWGLGNLFAIIILAGILIIGGSLLGNYAAEKQAQKAVAGSENFFQPIVEKTITSDGQDGKTALDILKIDHKVETQDSSLGIFVVSIDGTANTDTKYWMLYTDGKLAPESADTYQTKNGQKIEWRYEAF